MIAYSKTFFQKIIFQQNILNARLRIKCWKFLSVDKWGLFEDYIQKRNFENSTNRKKNPTRNSSNSTWSTSLSSSRSSCNLWFTFRKSNEIFFNFWRMWLLKWISCHFRVKIKERKFLGCLNPELRFFIFHKITLHLHFGSRSFNHSETWKK